jgi:hypothetical protein
MSTSKGKGKSVASSKSVSVTSSKLAGKTGDKGKAGDKGGKPRLVIMTADGEVDLTPLRYFAWLAVETMYMCSTHIHKRLG